MGNCCSFGKEDDDFSNLVRFSEFKGKNVNTSNFSVSGDGSVFANAPLLQTRAYWDFKIIEDGEFSLGVARHAKNDLDMQLNQRDNTWYMQSRSNNFKVGDTIGVSYDLSSVKSLLEFYHNGVKIEKATVKDIKGDVYPIASVKPGCLLEANFGQTKFEYQPPSMFDAVFLSRDML